MRRFLQVVIGLASLFIVFAAVCLILRLPIVNVVFEHFPMMATIASSKLTIASVAAPFAVLGYFGLMPQEDAQQ